MNDLRQHICSLWTATENDLLNICFHLIFCLRVSNFKGMKGCDSQKPVLVRAESGKTVGSHSAVTLSLQRDHLNS